MSITLLSQLFRRSQPNQVRRRTSRMRANAVESVEQRVMLSAGTLDSSFGNNGIVITDLGGAEYVAGTTSVAVQSDGRMLVAVTSGPNFNGDFSLLRFLENGSPDPSFGTNGVTTVDIGGDDIPTDLVIQPDGRIVVSGRTLTVGNPHTPNSVLARFNTNGTLDAGFGSGGVVITDYLAGAYDQYQDVDLQADGKIVTAVLAGVFGTPADFIVARFNSNGTPDATFGTAGRVNIDFGSNPEFITRAAVQADGRIVVGGSTLSGGNRNMAFARLLSNGSLDGSFGTGGKVLLTQPGLDVVNGMELDSLGRIVAGGSDSTGTIAAVVRLMPSGIVDTSFDSDGYATFALGGSRILSLALQTDDAILVSLDQYKTSSQIDFAIARLTAGGMLDPHFGSGGVAVTGVANGRHDHAISVAVRGDGSIFAGGSTWVSSSNRDIIVARFLGDGLNTKPVLTSLSVDESDILENESVTLEGSFTDADSGDQHTVTIDWGDGSIQVETLTIGARTFSWIHQYLDDGPSPGNNTDQDEYTILVTINDGNGGTTSSAAGGGWTQLAPTGGPPVARQSTGAVYDESTNQMIVFGGRTGSTLLNDLWRLSGANGDTPPQWSAVSVPGGPSPRWVHETVYDADSNRLIVHGGSQGSATPVSNETWVLSNANGSEPASPSWSLISASGPAPRFNHSAAYDDVNDRLIVFAGSNGVSLPSFGADVWVLSDADGIGSPVWTQLAPAASIPDRGGHEAVYDPASNRMIVFGGANNSGPGVVFNDVYVLTNANGLGGTPTWINITPASGPAPAPRAGFDMTFDEDDNRLIVYGGSNAAGRLNDVWVLTNASGVGGPSQWVEILPNAPQPAARNEHSMMFDAANDRLIHFAGLNSASSAGNEVWTLDVDLAGAFAAPQIVVRNVTPDFLAGPDESLPDGSGSFSRTGIAFTDPGTIDVHTVTIDYDGDDMIDQTINLSPGVRTIDLSYLYAASGTYIVTVTVGDDDTGSQTDSFVVTVVLNSPPTTSGIADVTVHEDAADLIIPLFDAFDDSQDADTDLAYSIQGNTNSTLFHGMPHINPLSGELTLDFAPDQHGTAVLTVRATDSGGLSVETAFTVTVLSVNDRPAFLPGPDLTVAEDSGTHSFSGWATQILAGPPDESTQSLTFLVSSNTNSSLFSSGPAIDPLTGDLTFTTASDANGTATVGIRLMDNGGTDFGGYDASFVAYFTVTIQSAAEQVAGLVDAIEALRNNGTLSSGQSNPPLNFLKQALKDLAKGKISQAVGKLNSFIDRIQQLVDSGSLLPAEGQSLIDSAEAAIVSALPGNSLRVESEAPVAPGGARTLTDQQLQESTALAIAYWNMNGATPSQLRQMGAITLHVIRLPHPFLGFASSTEVWLDATAAGFGWQTDGKSSDGGRHAADFRVDLLSVLVHEFGHVIGHDHRDQPFSVMRPTLAPGARNSEVARSIRPDATPGRRGLPASLYLPDRPADSLEFVPSLATASQHRWVRKSDSGHLQRAKQKVSGTSRLGSFRPKSEDIDQAFAPTVQSHSTEHLAPLLCDHVFICKESIQLPDMPDAHSVGLASGFATDDRLFNRPRDVDNESDPASSAVDRGSAAALITKASAPSGATYSSPAAAILAVTFGFLVRVWRKRHDHSD